MALKTLMLRKRIDLKKKELENVRAQLRELKKREDELEEAVEEVTTEEEQATVQESVDTLIEEKEKLEASAEKLGKVIEDLEAELTEAEEAQETEAPAEPAEPVERSKTRMNEIRTAEQPMELRSIVTRGDVKAFLGEVRAAIKEKRALTNAGLTIPDVMLDMVRRETAKASRLLPYVRMRRVAGKARQNIVGAIPEAVWTEMCANLNELDLVFNQVEVDGYKVGGFVPVCNATLEDSDADLAQEIITGIGIAIAKALDKAILFGTGTKMPTGIVTRLAQTSEPATWGTAAPDWTDLHSSNVQAINIDSTSGAAFFTSLVEKLAIAKPVYNADGLFWVMNRKTHLHILAKALAFDSSAALVANTKLMPVVGGDVVEFEDEEIADNEIIGGFGGNYLLAERAGVEFASSEHVRFMADQTVFRGTARYDGQPIAGEAFVIVNFNNTSPTTTKSFPEDYANTAMNDLTVTAAASASNAGKTVLTVSGTLDESSPTLKYKLGVYNFETGDALPSGFSSLTSGTTEITAAAGKHITVVELDDNSRIVSQGDVISIPKAAG